MYGPVLFSLSWDFMNSCISFYSHCIFGTTTIHHHLLSILLGPIVITINETTQNSSDFYVVLIMLVPSLPLRDCASY